MKMHPSLLASAALIACLSAVSAQAQTVSVLPSVSNIHVGDSISLDVKATDFPDKIFGGGYNLAFDPAILKLDGITIPASWEFATSTGTLNAAAGTVSDIFFNTFTNPVKGDFLTASLKFTAIASGTSAVTLSESGSFPFGNEAGNPVAVTFAGASVNVAAVPEPSTTALLLAGLACMGVVARRRGA